MEERTVATNDSLEQGFLLTLCVLSTLLSGEATPPIQSQNLIPPSWSPKMTIRVPCETSSAAIGIGREEPLYVIWQGSIQGMVSLSYQEQSIAIRTVQQCLLLKELIGKEVLICRGNREREHLDGALNLWPKSLRAHAHPSLIRWSSNWTLGAKLRRGERIGAAVGARSPRARRGNFIVFWGQREDIKAGA